ncbi:MAG TPA: carboxypeptidase regulatory-like domain-containing protein [Bacteroidia bacterium]|nr:carboxypeptidase regulatory-like domain-containing protein [Bacteroidia bacterium]HRG51789.1 carboxypeptidase regulatory-like domain-containing protein [Bacteroidia bacterium]
MYACHIYSGFIDIVDFKDKKNPKFLGTVSTPGKFPHNSWLNENSKVLFTTDEIDNSFLTAYDVSDPANIKLLDKVQSNPGSNSVVHNTHIIKVGNGEFAVTAWYRDGFTIVDVTRPLNMIQVGNYDTHPFSGGGMGGDWGVYPYFPSGTIVASSIDEGLFVCTPNYTRACYLEGVVTDSLTGLPINQADVTISGTLIKEKTLLTGNYATGLPAPGGTYSVTYSAAGYRSKTVSDVLLSSGVVMQKDIQLQKSPLSIFENELNTVNLNAYPNPFTNDIAIVYEFQSKQPEGSTIQLTDVLGKKIQEISITGMQGNISLGPELNAGIYYVRIVNSKASSNPVKLIKVQAF